MVRRKKDVSAMSSCKTKDVSVPTPGKRPFSEPGQSDYGEDNTEAQLTVCSTSNHANLAEPLLDNALQKATTDDEIASVQAPAVMIKCNSDHPMLIKALTQEFTGIKLTIRGDQIKIQLGQSHMYIKLLEFLNAQKIGFHTISPKNDVPVKVIIKGLHKTTRTEDIASDLQEKGFTVLRIVQFTRFKTKERLPIFLAYLKRQPGVYKALKLQCICHLQIKTEKFQSRTGPTQCHQCNGFGHNSTNCHYTPRCLKCSGPHISRECPDEEPATKKCINCNAEGHLACYRGCPSFPKPPPKQRKPAQRSHQSYAAAVKNTPPPSTAQEATPIAPPSAAPQPPDESYLQEFKDTMKAMKEVMELISSLPSLMEAIWQMETATTPTEKFQILMCELLGDLKHLK